MEDQAVFFTTEPSLQTKVPISKMLLVDAHDVIWGSHQEHLTQGSFDLYWPLLYA